MTASCLFKTTLPLFIISLFFFSCNPHFYKPKPLEPALLTDKNQLKINAISGLSVSSVSVAYSPIKSWGLQAGIATNHYKSSGTINANDTVYINESAFNPCLSSGFYKMIGRDLLFEIYTGIGLYNYKNTAIAYLKKMNNMNLFIQPSIGYVHDKSDAIFTLKIDYINRNKTIIKDSVLSPNDKSKYDFLNYRNYFFIQPGITLRAGVKAFKVQFQVSESIPLSNNYRSIYGYGFLVINSFINRNKLLYCLGITADLQKLFFNNE